MPETGEQKPSTRKKPSRGCVVWLAILGILIVLTPITLYERVNNIPNPFWGMFNGDYSYTPDKGLPDPSLLDSRPEDALLSVLRDYISVAGTYPCAADLAHWQDVDLINAPFAKGCAVVRPVAGISVMSVYVFHGFIEHGPQANVTYRVTRRGDASHYVDAHRREVPGLLLGVYAPGLLGHLGHLSSVS